MYEQHRMLEDQEIQHWLKNELFSAGWFVMVGITVVYYIVWLIRLDKSRAKDLLLSGALGAVFFHIAVMFLTEITGVIEYHIRDLPVQDTLFLSSTTLAPITIMIVQQYTASWKGFILWIAIGLAFLYFGVFEIYMAFGVMEFHNWNIFFYYLVAFSISLFTRLIYLWIAGIQKRFFDKKNSRVQMLR